MPLRHLPVLAAALLAGGCGSRVADSSPEAGVAGECLGEADGMIQLSGGRATIGCDPDRFDCSECDNLGEEWCIVMPLDTVEVRPFAMDVHEASGAGGLPLTAVTLDAAAQHCRSLGKRLPTWYEWEIAARGIDGDLYPWGDDPPSCERAHMDRCAPGGLLAVGSLPAGVSACGLHDLAGNVAEFIEAGFDTGFDDSKYFYRGGSFQTGAGGLRTFAASGDESIHASGAGWVGFRCARDL